jgi:DNA-binding IclR family transcriptional regulator
VSNSVDGRSVTSKLAAIIRAFSTGEVHSLSHIARVAGLPVSTAHRLTSELVEWEFLQRTGDKRYCVGPFLTEIGVQAWHEPTIREHARRVLDDLSAATRATVRFGFLKGPAVSYVEKRPNTRPVDTSFECRDLPAHATAMGKALLAFSGPEIVNEVIENGLDQFTPFTVVTAAALQRELKITRMTQVAMTRQELNLNTSAVAVPVFIGGGQVVGAIELTTTGAGFQLHLLQSAVLVAARGLSRELTASRCRNLTGAGALHHGSGVRTLEASRGRPGFVGAGPAALAAQDLTTGKLA